MADHVHILARLATTMPVSKGIQLVKGGSSKWVGDRFGHLATFPWQEGYTAFSVRVSQIQETIKYIEDRERHHRGKSFKEEYLSFLRKHGIEYDEGCLWE